MKYNLDSKEVKALIKKDKTLKILFEDIKEVNINIEEDYLKSLINSIISQQVSRKVARKISSNFFSYFTNYDENTLYNTDEEVYRTLSLSRQKTTYIKSLAKHLIDKTLDLKDIGKLSDEEVVEELIQVKGIGRWTAEMFLIFSLNRPNVYSILDLGLREGMKLLYKKDLTNKEIIELTNNYSPYKTVVSHFLWRYYEKNR